MQTIVERGCGLARETGTRTREQTGTGEVARVEARLSPR
jgi:hypothetical protein